MSKREYNNSSSQGPPCNYKQLGCYNNNEASLLTPGTTSGVYMTPDWNPIHYDALTHGKSGSCCNSGHFSITDAYGSSAGTCNNYPTYTKRLCGSGCGVPGGQQGYKCNQFMGKCHPGGRLGEQGVYGDLDECNKRCKHSENGQLVQEPFVSKPLQTEELRKFSKNVVSKYHPPKPNPHQQPSKKSNPNIVVKPPPMVITFKNQTEDSVSSDTIILPQR